MTDVRSMYSSLEGVNQHLVAEYIKRENNHTALLAALRDVNNIIQNASNLRAGQQRAEVLSACRAAIKQNRMSDIMRIVRIGVAQ
jgi:Bardet-Biedl syndrome 2 protein